MPTLMKRSDRKITPARPQQGVIRIGYVPLIDAAPLLMAEALGLFSDAGLQVKLERELGWGSIREKVVYGELEAAHAPGGLLYSILFGTHSRPCQVSTDLVLSLQGNAITLSRRFWEKGARDARSFRQLLRSEAPRKPAFAVVSAFSSPDYLLRKWLTEAGVNPDLVYQAIRGGLAGSTVLDAKAPMVMDRNFKPGFRIDLHIKDLANALANRLRRLEQIREASNRLMTRPQLRRDIFPRGQPETIAQVKHARWTATLYDLLSAYATQRQHRVLATVHLTKRTVWSLSEARASLERLVGSAESEDWASLDEHLMRYVVDPTQKATVFASSFAAALELVREGRLDLHQKEAFAPLYFRKHVAHLPPDALAAPEVQAD